MHYYSNPTANAAIGAIDSQIRKKKQRAAYLKKCKERGLLTPQQEAEAYRQFPGIFRPILTKALKGEKTSR